MTKTPLQFPPTVELLIVGAGPAGTAAAFRAKELGIDTLVVDRDRVLSQLAGWASVDPRTGVGVENGDDGPKSWPQGGPWVARLPFEEQTPADELLQRWLDVYQQAKIEVREGVALRGWTLASAGGYLVELLDLAAMSPHTIHARHVLLAIGSGSPGLPVVVGDPLGIATSCEDPSSFVGKAVCVLGQGPSAAEAVVKIVGAKAAAKDRTLVHWCPRQESLPKVAQQKALGVAMLEAMATGLVRLWPGSQPLMAGTDEHGEDCLVVGVDRGYRMEGGVEQFRCLRFPKRQVLAFLGSASHHPLLQQLGVALYASQDAPHKLRPLVRGELESSLPDVFFAGSVLHPAYFEASASNPSMAPNLVEYSTHFRGEFRHGVRVAEEVARRVSVQHQAATTQRIPGPPRRS